MDVLRFASNEAGRDFVVGDIHGCRADFDRLIDLAGFDEEVDRIFSVGDLVDRGPNSIGALDLLYEPWFHAVLGNHEQMMLDAYHGLSDGELWTINGGGWSRGLSVDEKARMRDLIRLVDDLPIAIVVGNDPNRFNVVHAEFSGTNAELDAGEYSQRRRMSCIWGRDVIKWSHGFDGYGLSPTYCGHTIVGHITRTASHVFIDTGAFCAHGNYGLEDGRLTMIEPATGETFVVRKSDYAEV